MALVLHRKARYNYEILQTYEAGIKLLGTEIKSLRAGGGSLEGSFARIIGGKLTLVGAYIAPFQGGGPYNHEERRDRPLLMHKQELLRINQKLTEKGLTLVPTKIYLKGSFAKIELALARGKRGPDKRKTIRQREEERHLQSLLKKHR